MALLFKHGGPKPTSLSWSLPLEEILLSVSAAKIYKKGDRGLLVLLPFYNRNSQINSHWQAHKIENYKANGLSIESISVQNFS